MLNGTIEQAGLSGPKFDIVAIPDRDAMSHFLVWNLCRTRVMPLVLVRDTAHWVALSSCDVSAIPAKANDPFDIVAVYIHDPSPISTLGIEHRDNDDCGGGHQQGYRDRHLTYQQWLNTYLTPVPKGKVGGLVCREYALRMRPRQRSHYAQLRRVLAAPLDREIEQGRPAHRPYSLMQPI